MRLGTLACTCAAGLSGPRKLCPLSLFMLCRSGRGIMPRCFHALTAGLQRHPTAKSRTCEGQLSRPSLVDKSSIWAPGAGHALISDFATKTGTPAVAGTLHPSPVLLHLLSPPVLSVSRRASLPCAGLQTGRSSGCYWDGNKAPSFVPTPALHLLLCPGCWEASQHTHCLRHSNG